MGEFTLEKEFQDLITDQTCWFGKFYQTQKWSMLVSLHTPEALYEYIRVIFRLLWATTGTQETRYV